MFTSMDGSETSRKLVVRRGQCVIGQSRDTSGPRASSSVILRCRTVTGLALFFTLKLRQNFKENNFLVVFPLPSSCNYLQA